MKFDMHCHTMEGSLDSKVKIEDYIRRLTKQGFGGMLITDHNSYNGYRAYSDTIKGKKFKNFVVLKGIEYDTFDAGHIIVVLPESKHLLLMELRGLPVHLLTDIVHRHGGILGPAHPYGEAYLSFMNTKKRRRKKELLKCFDFIETFNSCQPASVNKKAFSLARAFKKPGFGGSDAHKPDCVGMAYTELPDSIRTESDLIAYVRQTDHIKCGGKFYNKTTKDKIGKWNNILVFSFFFYNKFCAFVRRHKRTIETRNIIISKNSRSNTD